MKLTTTLSFLFLFFQLSAQTDCVNISTQILSTSCEGSNDGMINITVSEGTPPYTYEWSNGETTANINGLSPGLFSVTVTDSMGCTSQFPASNVLIDPFVIPDATGETLIVPIEVNQFSSNALVTTGDAFEVCVVMEHSWLRDLEILLRCPDGTSLVLHDHPGNVGGEVYMGEPIDGDEESPSPGIGYQYCWKSDASNGTILQNLKGEPQTLPEGTYMPFETFDNFIGCPLNGEWAIEITDSWGNDNGFVFDWNLSIDGADVEYLTVQDSEVDCTDCLENYYCLQWLRDTISNLGHQLPRFIQGNWDGRTVFAGIRGGTFDDGLILIFDCEGNLLQAIGSWSSNPDPPLVTLQQLTDEQTIWNLWGEFPLPDCGVALTLTDIIATDVSCFDATDGMVCANALGGLPPYTFIWEDESGFTLEGECISGIPAGTYSLVVKDLNNNPSAPTLITIAQPEEIIISIELVPDSENQICTPFLNIAGGMAPYSVIWSPEVVVDEVLVNVTDANGCTAEATANCIINGLDEMTGLEYFSLSPNPSTGIFNINAVFSQNTNLEIKVKSISGQELLYRQLNVQSLDEKIDLSFYPNGLYFVELISDKGRVVEKVVLSR